MSFLQGNYSMVDCSKEIIKFYNSAVRLPETARGELRANRKANQDRLKKRTKEQEKPEPNKFVKQGSYAMRTMIQQPDNDYDIDDGSVFLIDDLIGPNGADMTAIKARQMVCDVLQDDRFKKQPEVKNNCVRVYYDAGHHVDIPVYRKVKDDEGNISYELASSDWRESDPEGVTHWFNKAVIDNSPDESNGRQMRRIVCLLKKFARSRPSWNMPSGFILSKLADEKYSSDSDREDVSLYDTMRLIYERLCNNLEVQHPIIDEKLTNGTDDARTKELRDKLKESLENLQILFDTDCSKKYALKAWKKVFNDNFFDELIEDSGTKAFGGAITVGGAPSKPVDKKGGGRFG